MNESTRSHPFFHLCGSSVLLCCLSCPESLFLTHSFTQSDCERDMNLQYNRMEGVNCRWRGVPLSTMSISTQVHSVVLFIRPSQPSTSTIIAASPYNQAFKPSTNVSVNTASS
ncbi:unnamed protein product [Periconia digitata]|uniref:Uncharacterized protein n=1 Tax=Periconia digitata TaxID=1303443 RepID=A0A9W4XER4_9PLEO|nr:unnamed protein product [Periconia digitata]